MARKVYNLYLEASKLNSEDLFSHLHSLYMARKVNTLDLGPLKLTPEDFGFSELHSLYMARKVYCLDLGLKHIH